MLLVGCCCDLLMARLYSQLPPVTAMDKSPPSFEDVTNHAVSEHASPNGGAKVAAAQDWRLQMRVNADGKTWNFVRGG